MRFASIFTLVLLPVTVLAPFAIIALLYCLFQRLESPQIQERIGALYEGLKTKSRWALAYNAIFVARRFIYALIIVILKGQPAVQMLLFFYQSLAVYVYIIYAKPFDEPELNRLEIFNEVCILIAAYHLILFTDYLPDEQ